MYSIHGDHAALVGSILATGIGTCYFVQQQRLAETALFRQLFTDFNARYDKHNEELADALAHEELDGALRKKVIDYFNLCAEEYLFYREGYIPQIVWRSWCRGMDVYLRHGPIGRLWDIEAESGSYYGLSRDVIRKGAESDG